MTPITKEFKSFGYAFRGIWQLITNERHAKFHCIATIFVVAAGVFFHISKTEWLLVILTIGIVIGLEAINTAIEKLSDVVSPQQDKRIAYVKDIAAGAVLICAISAAIIGCLIFVPYLLNWII